jgi:hypothetical protein
VIIHQTIYLFIYLFIQVYCPYATLGYERLTPHLFNRYQYPFGHTSGASEIILTDPIYRLVAGGETSPWTQPSCDISPRGDIGVRAEIRTQNPVLSNTRLAKMVPLSHLRRPYISAKSKSHYLFSI